ncbi:glycosyltransferase family 4 protein [Mucilaginibacter sp.]|uniref:glycosyltransferase family 4 protein n=1 Tax=Mucilaginibacter sp. TaxID=1882438 RepID=UPI003B006F2C
MPIKPLIIGVDVRDLRVAKTGTKTYLEELCKAFKKLDDPNTIFYFLDSDFSIYQGNNKIFKLFEHVKYLLWKQFTLPLKAWSKNCNVVFCTDNVVPLVRLGYKTIPVFHDAFFFENPENYGKLWLWLYKKTALPAAKKSPFVITPSFYAKQQIQKFTSLTADQLVVIYEGVKTSSAAETVFPQKTSERFSLLPSNYILHVGSMFKRKNIPALITAFSRIKTLNYPDLKLVLAGSIPSSKTESDYQQITETIARTNLQNEVVITGYISDDELDTLYKNALMYIFPSINEGFGLPVLEAFEHNLPVLVANNTCLPEVGGNAVLTFDPFDSDAVFMAIKTVLENAGLRKEMVEKGRQRLQDFSWIKTASQIIEVFKKAV